MNEDLTRVEERVRAMLDRHADRAPTGTAMLAAVHLESQRQARRRRSTVGVAVTVLALVAVVAGLAVVRVGAWRSWAQPTATGHAVQFVSGSADVTVPFWLPEAYQYADPVGTLVAGQPVLTLAATQAGLEPITVEVRTDAPELGPKIIAAAPRWVEAGRDGDRIIFWTTTGGLWLKLSAPAAYPAPFLTKLLDGMDRTRSMRLPAPVRFDTVPDGFTVDNIDASKVTFCPPGVRPSAGTDGKLVVSWQPTGDALRTGAVNVATAPDGSTIVTVDNGGSELLTLHVPPSVAVNLDDLLRFAAGIHRQP